jgi:tripeptide aminopeptidase
MADRVTAELEAAGLTVVEDDTAAVTGMGCGNLLATLSGTSDRTILLCAHLDTVPHEGVVVPVCEDGAWTSAGDTILGADNKAAVAVLLALVRRTAAHGPPPVNVELLFTAAEEVGLAGATAFDASQLTADLGYVFDQASPIGEVVMASPTSYKIAAHFHGRPAHAGIRPEDGRSAIVAAAKAIAALDWGRIDPETTTNVGSIKGGVGGTNVVAEHASFLAEARSLDPAKAEAAVARIVDAAHDAANDPVCSCDLDIDVERSFQGYRHTASQPAVLAAEAALRACGFTPTRITTGGGTDGNAIAAHPQGIPVTNLANGTEHNHEATERVTVAALEAMLDVTLALLDELAPREGAPA